MSSWGKAFRGRRAAVVAAVPTVSLTSSGTFRSREPANHDLIGRDSHGPTIIARPVRVVGAVLAVGVVAAVTGCSGDSHTAAKTTSASASSGAASAQSAPASNTAWDPCSIPNADLAAAGLNPATKHTGAAGVKFPGWDICTWDGNSSVWYSLELYSTNSHTYDEVIHNTTLFQDPQPVTVNGRTGTLLHHVNESDACTIAFDSVDPVQVEVSAKLSADSPGDTCAEATQIAGELMKDLPAAK